jgi:KipI family sensor histidine kinase inhibitor
MIKKVTHLGDSALYCDFGNEANKNTNLKVIKVFKHLQGLIKNKKVEGINNLIPSYNKLIVSFDLKKTNFQKLKERLSELNFENTDNSSAIKLIKIPVCYDEPFSLDLESLSNILKLSKEEIINKHISGNYFVYMTGFIAGMPFVGDLSKDLHSNRLETPRVKVPAGSVGIVEKFCNIYTHESPGGWNIIGNTPLRIFDKKNLNKPAVLSPGDQVRFYKISSKEFKEFNDK